MKGCQIMSFPNRVVVQRIRETYPVGCRVELIGMGPDPYSKLERGNQGTVNHVDCLLYTSDAADEL